MPCSPLRVWTALQRASAGDSTPRDVSTTDDNAIPSHNAQLGDGDTEGGQA